jgi:purine-nucleoside phosphorylase
MEAETIYAMLGESAAFLKGKLGSRKPTVGVLLGSGLAALASAVEDRVEIPYGDIPNYPTSSVAGHAGVLVAGRIGNTDVVLLRGRNHNYEGWEPWQMTYGVRTLKLLGVGRIIIVNAAGGVNRNFKRGDLMIITDHIATFAPSVLRGPNLDRFGPRFPDLSHAYDPEGIALAAKIARESGFEFRQGVYAFAQGPMYETPAEIRMFAHLGADTIGMSTVGEVIVANHAGMKVLGISTVTNMAAGIQTEPLNHQEVLETERAVEAKLTAVLVKVIGQWK